ncbi:uncharacterized protein B0I36DRAFT_356905 [Microdochium trichocladiopsis]|uniref:Uncharacterized protein n=1 Tax=Microdochium trichocladiopsis TaxID=1682393 RepID=A0A9P9BK50_9PEZI|nr:uncharacterized protein B0I36DRAFT_356905 [Microdochium trichocladiopsis]KAH7007961.1 hypothetical protein B0I36DRAFT_356905 [Microdochium trichocladiopsis]
MYDVPWRTRTRTEQTIPASSRPLSPSMIDFEIRALGGMTTAFDTKPEELQNLKSPIPVGDRIIELNVENARLRREIDYYKTLTNEVLHPLLAHVRFHTQGLFSAVQRLDAKIEEANARL